MIFGCLGRQQTCFELVAWQNKNELKFQGQKSISDLAYQGALCDSTLSSSLNFFFLCIFL